MEINDRYILSTTEIWINSFVFIIMRSCDLYHSNELIEL